MFHAHPISEATASARDAHNSEALRILVSAIRAAQDSGDLIAGQVERIASYLVLAPHGLASFQAQGHVPDFIARQDPGPLTSDWLALLSLQPLMTNPMTPEDITRGFFS